MQRVDDRRVLNGIFWWFRTGSPWADIPERYGAHTTCYNRFTCWSYAGIWDRLLAAMTEACDGDIVMIDSSHVRVRQHGAAPEKKRESPRRRRYWPLLRRADHQDPRGRRCRRTPIRLGLSPGQDCTKVLPLLDHFDKGTVLLDDRTTTSMQSVALLMNAAPGLTSRPGATERPATRSASGSVDCETWPSASSANSNSLEASPRDITEKPKTSSQPPSSSP